MIQFTQFLRPDGRPRTIEIARSDEIEAKARDLIGNQCSFECEVLTTGEVSFTCEHLPDSDDPENLAIEVVQNGPGIGEAVDRLVNDAHDELYRPASQ